MQMPLDLNQRRFFLFRTQMYRCVHVSVVVHSDSLSYNVQMSKRRARLSTSMPQALIVYFPSCSARLGGPLGSRFCVTVFGNSEHFSEEALSPQTLAESSRRGRVCLGTIRGLATFGRLGGRLRLCRGFALLGCW